MRPNYLKFGFAILLTLYFLWIAYDPMQGSFLDNVDLPIHEFGHLLFRPFGQFMMVAGGSLFQVIVPLIFVGYFFWNGPLYSVGSFLWKDRFWSAAIVSFWVGQSLLNVYVYAADAVVMRLVLTSGFTGSEGSFHDWNYLLTATGLLSSTKTVAGIIRFVGTLTILGAGVCSIYYSLYGGEAEEE